MSMINQERSHVPPAVLAEAAEWFAVLGSGQENTTETEQWQTWLNAHPDHRAAWSRVEYFTGKFHNLPANAASAALNTPDFYRRRTLKALALFGVIGLSGWRISREDYFKELTADYQTALGITKTITLADGSKVTLDTNSAFNVKFTPTVRQMQLVTGEIYIETAPDNSGQHRPFVVDSQEGRVMALGTRFSVRQQKGYSQVNVYADAVEIRPAKPNASQLILKTGQATRFTQEHIDTLESVNAERPAWTQGILLADNMPLSEFLLQVNRYRHGYISCDPQIAGLRIVGAYPLNNTDRILATLEQTLPVKITRPLPLWVKVLPSS